VKGRKTGGRTAGTPNKATAEAREFCSRLVDDPSYQAHLQKRLRAGKLSPAVECMIWHYAKGKPTEQIGLEGGQPITIRWQDDARQAGALEKLD